MPERPKKKQIPLKPAFGTPCNGCGVCCEIEVCGLGVEVFGEILGPCPAIVKRDGRFWCGVVEAATKKDVAFGGWFAWRLGIGRGCQMEDAEKL